MRWYLGVVAALALAACGPDGLGTPGATGTGGGAGGGGGSTTSGCTSTDTWANYGAGFFASNCGGCHNFGQSTVQSNPGLISSYISSGRMPPGGLSSADRTRVLAYLSCGAP